ncbi:MAG: hypothetical protein COX29_00950 [Candidatus Moranbacteria bacterium CG23_combo_of_CG06-09_8_20_14_all_35_22]|nr:MAG: hypothetical protein COX29_00950 [Candidatus Moranbacteria bacterium CG23_combo_of_CG06-09_8_20_14_all_35_22]
MKKILSIAVASFLVLIFSGCANNKTTTVPKFTLSQSIWKSIDGGADWQVKNKGEGKANIKEMDILSLAFNPYDKNNIYVGLRSGGILETIDGGETWKFMNYTSEKVYGLALSPADGRTLYASGVWQGTGKMFKTQDRGENWTEIYTSPSAGPLIISLAIDPKNSNIIYATTSEKEAIKSMDGGTTWRNILLADEPIIKIVLDSKNSNLIYFLATTGKVLRSKDAGVSFEDISGKISGDFFSFSRRGFTSIETDPTRADYVYLAGEAGILMSKDSGETWQEILALNNPENFPIKALAINPKNPNEMVYAMNQATYKSVDGGKTWKTFQFDNKMKANILEYNPTEGTELYIGFTK